MAQIYFTSREFLSPRKIFLEKAAGILVRAAFPRGMRVGEIDGKVRTKYRLTYLRYSKVRRRL